MFNYGTWGEDLESVLQLLPVNLAGQPRLLLQLDRKTKSHSSNEDIKDLKRGKVIKKIKLYYQRS
jgi:hypothetical protein